MRRLNVKTKREAVDLALRRVAGPRLTKDDFDAVRGIGFEIELAELRNDGSVGGDRPPGGYLGVDRMVAGYRSLRCGPALLPAAWPLSTGCWELRSSSISTLASTSTLLQVSTAPPGRWAGRYRSLMDA